MIADLLADAGGNVLRGTLLVEPDYGLPSDIEALVETLERWRCRLQELDDPDAAATRRLIAFVLGLLLGAAGIWSLTR